MHAPKSAASLRAFAVPALLVAASMLLLSGCMLSAVLPAAGWLTAAIGLALGLAACSSSGGGGGGGGGGDESATLSVSDASAYENEGNVTFEVTLSEALSNEVTLSYETSDGTAEAGEDYEDTAGDVSIPANSTESQSIVIPTIDNDVFDVARTFTLTLTEASASGATVTIDVDVATGTIRNDEATLDLDTVDATAQESFRVFNGGSGASFKAGASVAGLDIDGDGKSDVVIGEPGQAGGGRAYVLYGSNALAQTTTLNLGLSGTPNSSFVIENPTGTSRLGNSVASVGDFDEDGKDDLLIGARGRDIGSSRLGIAVFIAGDNDDRASGLVQADYTGSDADAVFFHLSPSSRTANVVGTAGDVNGDGIPDFLIGDSRMNTYAGEVQVVSGAFVNGDPTVDIYAGFAGVVIKDESANAQFGTSVAGACDFNGDGYDDIIVGVPLFDPGGITDAGLVHIIFGGSELFDEPAPGLNVDGGEISDSIAVTYTGDDQHYRLGMSVACAGDINADGFDDVIIGASRYNNYEGTVYVLYGSETPSSFELTPASLSGGAGFRINVSDSLTVPDHFGLGVAGGADLNADGTPDIVVTSGTNTTSSVFVIFGDPDGMGEAGEFELAPITAQRVVRLNGEATDMHGTSFSPGLVIAGDVDGDGEADLLIGFADSNPSAISDAGRAYLIFGSGF